MIVTRNGKVIKLGPKEYKILTLLMENPGQIFSRSKLLDIVWGHDVYVEERTIDVHMSRLRKSLNNYGHDVIRTVRDGGYGLYINNRA